jgi:predicted nucleotidyltransferase
MRGPSTSARHSEFSDAGAVGRDGGRGRGAACYLSPMTVREQVRLLRREILDAAEANGARRIRLFGSAARGQETGESDVDLLVTLEPGRTLMDLARLEARLERLLNRIVDVVPESGLREPFRSSVLRDAIDV